jgi:hypothetical protein
MTYEHIKKIYPKHNTAWSDEEIAFLIKAKERDQKNWKSVGEYLGRKPSSCSQRYSLIKKDNSFVIKKETPTLKKETPNYIVKKSKKIVIISATTEVTVDNGEVTIKMK